MPATPEQVEALRAYVRADPTDDHVRLCANAAASHVERAIRGAMVPPAVVATAVLEVGANLFNRRTSSRDSSTALDVDMNPSFSRPALDPLTPAWPILRPYLGPGIV